MVQAERSNTTPNGRSGAFEDESALQAQAASLYRSRGVPGDWYVDPADPQAAERYRSAEAESIEDQATAFLAAHEALEDGIELRIGAPEKPGSVELTGHADQAVWIGLPGMPLADPSDEGELGWQADALCAQTDPEAFFPEKGGSTRDAKKSLRLLQRPLAMPRVRSFQ